MKKFRKVLALTLCAAALVGASVMGTMAYLTDNDEVTNTFTVGNVDITLDEAKVDKMGQQVDNERWQPTETDTEQEYHLLPGHTYIKDPTVTVKAGSEDAYVRMLVTINKQSELDEIFKTINEDRKAVDTKAKELTIQDVLTGANNDDWQLLKETEKDDNTRTYEFRYKNTVDGYNDDGAKRDEKLPALFTKIVMPGEITNEQLATLVDVNAQGEIINQLNITVEAHAIQADGFDDANKAWGAFDKEKNSAN